ncbi:zinc finger protein [Rhodotorula toruloides]|uniref:RING-type E3 ubiquitin transferase n=1 Tax=Rhodotorula toruloides TaxID=5286 RepID=A0A511KNG8_RHOTO|nr:zinc finger protein [Rhodotorula toruloides]
MSRRANFGAALTGDDAGPPSSASRPPPASTRGAGNGGADAGGRQDSRGHGGDKGKGKARSGGQGSHRTQQLGDGGVAAGVPRRAELAERVAAVNAAALAMAKAAEEAGETEQDGTLCFICAEPVQYWAVGPCNHRTCHTCSIRLRALYKKKECTFCKLGILFESRAQLDDTLSLLRFNCPYKPNHSDPVSAAPDSPAEACPHILSGWSDLKRHVRSSHHCTLCDLCCSNKKIFAHEHELFAMSAGGDPRGRKETELDLHLETQHSMCGFCKRWFYDSDGLYKHCREHHEECFICVRQGIRHQYHLNYDRLEQHFKADHFLCPHPDCLAQKFVVFESELDLQAHALEVHGVGTFDQKARKEARRIETHFVYSTGESSARNDGGRRRAGPGGRAPAASFVEPTRDDVRGTPPGTVERRIPGLGAPVASGSGSRASRFGGQLTAEASPPASGATTPTSLSSGERDPATLERHAALMRRVQEVTHGHEGKIAGFKIAVRSYRQGEMSAQDLCEQLYNLLDQRTDEAGSVILAFADLLDDQEKRRSVQLAWRDLRSENNFPSLAALNPTLHGVPTTTNNTSQRALSAQHRSGGNPSSTWARVEQAATSAGPAPVAPRSNPFPALMSASNAKSIPGLAKAGVQKKRSVGSGTAWSSAAGGSSSSGPSAGPSVFPSLSSSSRPSPAQTPVSISRPGSSAGSSRAPPRAPSGFDFPSLQPSSTESDKRARMRAALAKPVGRTIVDDGEQGGGIWNGSGAGGSGAVTPEGDEAGGTGRRKGKGKKKVVLMSNGLMSSQTT